MLVAGVLVASVLPPAAMASAADPAMAMFGWWWLREAACCAMFGECVGGLVSLCQSSWFAFVFNRHASVSVVVVAGPELGTRIVLTSLLHNRNKESFASKRQK
eukprot:m.309236 g.309236  ORF g.309236 m.309236 type:complete len:103 (-) comp19637_c0_seq5:3074-3382(-)